MSSAAVSVPWREVMVLDEARRCVRGSDGALRDAIAAGADLRIATEFRHEEHIEPGSAMKDLVREVCDFRVTYLLDGRWVAGIMTLRQPVTLPDRFGEPPSMSFFLYNQDGEQAIARPYLDGPPAAGAPGPAEVTPPPDMPRYHVRDGQDGDTNAPSHNFVYEFDSYRYLTRQTWRELYAHDADGHAISGSLDDLFDAFSAGCELKVGITGLCADLVDDPAQALPHEVFIQLGPGYFYTQRRWLLACSHPLVRVAPGIPLRYRSGGWDFGWVLPRTDGHTALRIYDPYTLQPRQFHRRYAMRWFVQ